MSTSDKPAPYPPDTRAKGWRFELDYEKIDQSDTWGLAAAMAMEGLPLARPLLLAMWYAAWKQTPCGSLPADEKLLAAAIGIPMAVLRDYNDVLMRGWWLADDGRLYHDTLMQRVVEMVEYRSKNAKRVAEFKAAQREQRSGNALPTREQQAATDTGTGTGTNTKAIAFVAPKSARAARKCPATFEPDEPQAWIDQQCPGLDWRRETEKFRDCTFKSARTDWIGTWRNWMRKAFDDRAGAGPPGLTFRERDVANATAQVHEMTGGLVSAKPIPNTRRNDALQEVFDAAPRRIG